MSKQIALLLDNSGSMFAPVGTGNLNNKITEAANGTRLFIQNLIDRMTATPGSQFALSVHRFASSYQLLPGGAQVDSGSGSFAANLASMKGQIAQIENEAASQAAIGSMTDLYDGVRRTSDYMVANNPSFGAPGSRVIVLFSDGIQTIFHGGGTTLASYEAATGQSFAALLNGRGIKFIAWGVGTDALQLVLEGLDAMAVQGATTPGSNLFSTTKVLYPDPTIKWPTCPGATTVIASAAFSVVDDNGVLPLRPTWRPPSGLLWEQFSLPMPAFNLGAPTSALSSVQQVNYADFEVDVDGMTRELILAAVSFRPGSPSLIAASPSGTTLTHGSPGTRTIAEPTVRTLKIESPEAGIWRVRVNGGDDWRPMLLDLMARGICRELSLQVEADPHLLPAAGKSKVTAFPRLDGKPLKGKLTVSALVLGGGTYKLAGQADGSFTGTVEVTTPGRNPIRVELKGSLEDGRTVDRVEFAVVQVGPALDPRFTVTPDTYEQGGNYKVALHLRDGQFGPTSSLRMGTGIAVEHLDILNEYHAVAGIRVDASAFVGTREAVLYAPMAESEGVVRVVEGRRGGEIPPGSHGSHQGRICCLRFDADGKLIGVLLCDGATVCVARHDDRVQRLLEAARDHDLTVNIFVDARGCLIAVDICR
jgi:hypothetical protein